MGQRGAGRGICRLWGRVIGGAWWGGGLGSGNTRGGFDGGEGGCKQVLYGLL